jgi:uncharacterized protein (TIGR02300 family)
MPAKDLGVKHTCWKCGTKFYDLKKPEPVCPKCGSDPRAAPAVKASPPAERRRAAVEEPLEEIEAVEEADLDDELEEEADEPAERTDEDS